MNCNPCFNGEKFTTCCNCDKEYVLVDPKELETLRAELEKYKELEKYILGHDSKLLQARAQNAIYRAALERLEFDLKQNADSNQSYGGFHTVLDEFQSILGRTQKALASSPDELLGAIKSAITAMDHALYLGYCGEGSTQGMVTEALTRLKKAIGEA